MDAEFWHQRWQHNEIGFHEGEANALLVKYFQQLALPLGSRVFVPLCGKTRDIAWLLSQGYRVAGAELSPIAIEQLFVELGVTPKVTVDDGMIQYRTPNLDIFVGDIFNVSRAMLGTVDAIYDRAALVALPADMRQRYTVHLQDMTQQAPQLLICFDYDQSVLPGPPFAISNDEVAQHYASSYQLSLLANVTVPGGLKGQCPAQENLWLLQRKTSSL